MSQQLKSSRLRGCAHQLSGYFTVLAALLLTLVAPSAHAAPTACNILYAISPQNTSAFGAAITIENTGTTALTSWSLTWAFANGQTVSELWNGIETQSGANVTVTNESYNGSIAAGASLTGLGFNGTWNGATNAIPTAFSLSGTACSVNGVAPGGGGSFSLKPSAATLSIAQGASATDAITVTDTGGFNGAVTLTAASSNSGVTVTVSGDTLTIKASSTATGSATITVTGTSGTTTATTTIGVTISPMGSFSIAPSPTNCTIPQGGSCTVAITITDTGGFTGAVTLTAASSNPGVTVIFSGNTLTIKASSTASGTGTVTVTGTSGAITTTTTITVIITTTGSFLLTPSPSSLSIGPGASVTDTITITDIGGFTGPVTLAASGLPTGVTAAFATNPTTSTSVLTLTASCSVAIGTGTVTITGTSGSLSATTTIALTANGAIPTGFTLAPSAATLSIAQGGSGTETIVVKQASSCAANSVTLAASGLPAGVTAAFATNPTTSTSVLTLTASSTAAAATTAITITGTSGSLTATTTIALTVTGAKSGGSFTLTPSPGTMSLAQNTSATSTITVTDVSPFSGSVTLAASGLPSGVTATFTVNPATTSSVVTFAVSSTATPGTTTVTITGTSGSLTASTPISLTVTAATGSGTMACTIAYATTSQSSVAFGGTIGIDNTGTANWGSWTLTWTWANGQGISDIWNGIYSQTGGNVTITNEPYNGTIAAGSSYSGMGFDGTWNGVTNTTPTNFAVNGTTCVNGGSGFTLLASTPTLAVNEGSTSSADTITVKDFGGFTGSVTLAAASLPSGITAAFGANPTTGSSTVTFTAAPTVLSGIYTVTINGTSGSTTATTTIALNVSGTTNVTVNSTSTGIPISDTLLGMNMASWYDIVANDTAIVDAFQTAGIKAIRWPGGSWADIYHWATNTNCFESSDGTPAANDTFVNFVNDLVIPAGLDVALTADYGTDAACTGPGQPSEAAAWVAAALTDGITVSHMTVGNEVYGSWEEDLHTEKNNAATYASSVVGSAGFYEAIKAASPNTLVGIVVDADNTAGGWDNTVLSNAKGYYDFVEYHNYPQAPGDESDTTLIDQDAQLLTTDIDIIKSELTEWGTPDTPIYVGEMGSVYTNPGKQSWSITQGLFAGQELGEMMNDGVSRATWWIGFGNCNGTAGNMSASLFGWQDFGGYNVFSGGPDDPTGTCPGAGPIGTLNPTAVAFQLFSNLAVTGEHVLSTSVAGDSADVVAYAATHSGGTALFLVNRNETASEIVSIAVPGQTTASSVTEITYSEAIYNLSGSPTGTFPDPAGTNTWAPPTTTTISSPTLPLSLTLPPWSMNVVIIP